MAKGLYKRGRVWWICYAGIDGKVIRESSGTTKYREAEEILIRRKKAIQDGKQPERKRIKKYYFEELTERYVDWMTGRHKSANSKMSRIKDILSHFGNLPLRSFSTYAVEQYQTKLMDKGLKPASVNKNISILKAMIKKAVEWKMIEEHVLKEVGKVKLLPANNKRLRYLSKEECKALISTCRPHLKPIVITALNTGMRYGEILGLEWNKHIDLKHGFILLDRTKNGERRQIPINQTLRNTLKSLPRRLDNPYVFCSKDGKKYVEIHCSFNTALRKAGIHDFRFHDLRHTFASHLVMAGVDITTVKDLLGHKTLTMTLRYAHLASGHVRNAVNILDSAINGEDKSTSQLLHNSTK